MANIPAHMRIRDDLTVAHRTRRSSMAMLVVVGVSIGLIIAVVVYIGLIH
jgi:hypothetical protein